MTRLESPIVWASGLVACVPVSAPFLPIVPQKESRRLSAVTFPFAIESFSLLSKSPSFSSSIYALLGLKKFLPNDQLGPSREESHDASRKSSFPFLLFEEEQRDH